MARKLSMTSCDVPRVVSCRQTMNVGENIPFSMNVEEH